MSYGPMCDLINVDQTLKHVCRKVSLYYIYLCL